MTTLTFNEKAELHAIVHMGGRTRLIRRWEGDRTHISLVRKGMIRWGRRDKLMVDCHATREGKRIASRFRKDWSAAWAERNPIESEE